MLPRTRRERGCGSYAKSRTSRQQAICPARDRCARDCAAIQEKLSDAALNKARARTTAVRQVQDQPAASNLPSARSSNRYCAAIQEKPIEAPLTKACAALTKVRASTRAISQVQAEAATDHLQSVRARARTLGAAQAAPRTSSWPRATTRAVPFLSKKEAIRRAKRREARLNRLSDRIVRRRLSSS